MNVQAHAGRYEEKEVIEMELSIEVWGDFACFTPPYAKVERLTYPFPTPSACRGILSAIYSKPEEFYWQVNQIEILNPIQYMSFKRNEIKTRVSKKMKVIYADEERTQRQTIVLKDVRYRITASICPRSAFKGKEQHLYDQAYRRIRNGKCYYQPSLGLREFVAYFEESDGSREPIDINMDVGLMVYDIFDLHDYKVRGKAKPQLSLYHAVVEHGVVKVPVYDSSDVLKGGREC